ncbi:MAG: VC0807 family protein [Opitutaceae bacterium]
MTHPAQTNPTEVRQENLWLNLLCNIVVPALILTTLSKPERLGPVWALIIGVSLPLGYGIYDLVVRRKWNFFSILGLISILLTGGLGLLGISPFWFAVKEAAIPLTFGLAVLGSLFTPFPLVRTFLYNDRMINVARVDAELDRLTHHESFERLLTTSTYLLATAFFVSAVLNFALARFVIKSPGGSPEFAAELGRMTALSWPVITIPVLVVMIVALWRLINGIKKLTGLELDDILKTQPEKKK